MEKFVLASNNKNKLRELRELCGEENLLSMEQAGVYANPEENGNSFEENALIKAREVAKLCKMPTIADDSGLVVEALGGEPGIYSARYGGEECRSDEERCSYLLKKMEGMEQRAAKFVSTIARVYPDGRETVVRGECRGLITKAPAGENGFGYDPIFFVEEFGKTMAELSPEEKNRISHRAMALKELKKVLER